MSDPIAKIVSRAIFLTEEHKLQGIFSLAMSATLKAQDIAYVSVPITSGKRLYDFMDKYGFKTIAEAKADHDLFFKEVMTPNFDDGILVSDEWAKKIRGAVVAPAEFEKMLRSEFAITWGQDDFMVMWVRLIDKKITKMIMIDGWEYSNGSGEEYLQAALMQMGRSSRANISIIDGNGPDGGLDITLETGIGLMVKAFKDVHGRGIKAPNMAETVAILLEMEHRFNVQYTTGRSAEPDGKLSTCDTVLPYDRATLVAAREELRPIFEKDYPHILPTLEKTSSFDWSPGNAVFRSNVLKPAAAPATRPAIGGPKQ